MTSNTPRARNALCVWIVDDVPDEWEALERIIENLAHSFKAWLGARKLVIRPPFHFVADAQAAFLTAPHGERPDVIVADVMMKARPSDHVTSATAGAIALFNWFEKQSGVPIRERPLLLITTNNEEAADGAIQPLLKKRSLLPPEDRWFQYWPKSLAAGRANQPAADQLPSDEAWATCFRAAVVEWIKRDQARAVPRLDLATGFGPIFPVLRSEIDKAARSTLVLLAGGEPWERDLLADTVLERAKAYAQVAAEAELAACNLTRGDAIAAVLAGIPSCQALFIDGVAAEHCAEVLRTHKAGHAYRPKLLIVGGPELDVLCASAEPNSIVATLYDEGRRTVLKLEPNLSKWGDQGTRYLAEQLLRAEENRCLPLIRHSVVGEAGEFVRFGSLRQLRAAMARVAAAELCEWRVADLLDAHAPPTAVAPAESAPLDFLPPEGELLFTCFPTQWRVRLTVVGRAADISFADTTGMPFYIFCHWLWRHSQPPVTGLSQTDAQSEYTNWQDKPQGFELRAGSGYVPAVGDMRKLVVDAGGVWTQILPRVDQPPARKRHGFFPNLVNRKVRFENGERNS